MKKSTGPTRRGVMGRWSIFRDRVYDNDHRFQGWVSKKGRRGFEVARAELGMLYWRTMGREASSVSDADTIEYLARGRTETRKYLVALAREERRNAHR